MLENENGRAPSMFGNRIDKALALMPDAEGEADLNEHVRWELGEVLSRLRMDDLRTREAMALLALLAPIHSRVIRLSTKPEGPAATILQILRP